MQESCHSQYDLVCSSTGLLGNFPDHQKHSEAYFVAVLVLLVLEVLGCPQRLGCVFHLSDLFYFSDLFGIGFYHHLLIMCQLLLFQTLWCKCMIQVIPSLSNCTCYSLDILGTPTNQQCGYFNRSTQQDVTYPLANKDGSRKINQV